MAMNHVVVGCSVVRDFVFLVPRATRQADAGLLPLPQMKEAKPHSSRHGKSQKSHSQKHKSSESTRTSCDNSSGGKSSLSHSSPHSILGPGPGSEPGTTRRHNSTGSRIEHSSNPFSTSITRSNSTAVSESSKSVSPDLSPKSSLSTSSSSGSLKQDLESRGVGPIVGGGGGGGNEGKNSEREVSCTYYGEGCIHSYRDFIHVHVHAQELLYTCTI